MLVVAAATTRIAMALAIPLFIQCHAIIDYRHAAAFAVMLFAERYY